jgi:hypothetical protein
MPDRRSLSGVFLYGRTEQRWFSEIENQGKIEIRERDEKGLRQRAEKAARKRTRIRAG